MVNRRAPKSPWSSAPKLCLKTCLLLAVLAGVSQRAEAMQPTSGRDIGDDAARRAVTLAGDITTANVSPSASSALVIRITSPVAASVIERLTILVRGEISSPTGMDVGVSVNGMAGFVGGNQFVALVPVNPSLTVLTATANSFTGTLATSSIPITVKTSAVEPPIELKATPPAGLAPLTVSFDFEPRISVRQIALDADGDGTADRQSATLRGMSFTFSEPGVYPSLVTFTDLNGQAETATTIVQVYDRAALDQRLQAVWQGIRDALRMGDVSRAVSFIHSDRRERYRAQFRQLTPAARARVDQFMPPIHFVSVDFGGAQYEMLRQQDGQTYSYAVWFGVDLDGLWRLWRF
jgi:hypothetical protein